MEPMAYPEWTNFHADSGDAHFIGAAFEQHHSEFCFKFFDGHRQRGLADEALFGGAAEMFFARDGDDVAEFGEGHNFGIAQASSFDTPGGGVNRICDVPATFSRPPQNSTHLR